MTNSVPKVFKVLVAGLVLVSNHIFAETMSRDQAFEPIQEYIEAKRDWQRQTKKARKDAQTKKTMEERRELLMSVGPPPGNAQDLADEAEWVLQADATDDRAFATISFVLQELGGSNGGSEALRNNAFDLLLKHHITHESLMRVFGEAPGKIEKQIDAYDQIVAKSPHSKVKVEATMRTIQAIDKVVGQPMSMDDRRNLVTQIEARVAFLDRDFSELKGVDRRGAEFSYVDMARKSYDAAEALLVSHKIADFDVLDIDGNSDKLSHYRGKYVLLDFWATWCGPCIKGMPALVKLSEALAGQPFEIISLSLDKDPETVVQFQENQPMPWVNWHMGADNSALKEFNLSGVPLYILLDPEGNVLSRSHYLNDDAKQYIKHLVTSRS